MVKAKQPKVKLSPAERMLESKRKHIARLKREIEWIFEDAEQRAKKIRGRIKISEALADALEKGTLKP